MASLLALGYSMLTQSSETDEKNGTDAPVTDDNASKPDAHAPTSDSNPAASTKSTTHPPSSFKDAPKLLNGESSSKPSRHPSVRRSSTKASGDGESTRKGSSKESKRHKVHASTQELDDQYAKQMAKVAKLMRKMARAEQREKNARWKAAMQDITLAREAGIDPQKEKVGWDDDSDDEATPGRGDNTLQKPITDLSAKSTDEDAPPPESGDTLARFIHAMFSSINPFEEAHVESKDDDAKPATDAAEAHNKSSSKDPKDPQSDPEVLRLLSSASTMNQSSQSRGSVWNVLDRLTPGRAKKSGAGEEGSVMLSAPLFVTEDSKVTVAQSEMKTVEEHESDTEDTKPNSSKFAGLVTRMGMDGMFGKKKREKEEAEAEQAAEPEAVVEIEPEPEQPKSKEVRVWRPSADGISLQCSWWGYRIYLPPAVIAVLNDQKLEAANRAAIVTTALQWIIDHIPTAGLPPQVGLVMSLVRGIIPAMGYIGGFVAWSWNTIIGFDQGDGVVLSATWLLPIALIPSAWDIEPVGMPVKAVEPEPTPEPTPQSKPEPRPEPKLERKSRPQPEPEVEVKAAKLSHSRSASTAKAMPPLERNASVKSSSTIAKEKKAERKVLERSITSPVPIPQRPPHPPRQPTLAGPLPTPPSSVPRSSSSVKTHSHSHSHSRSSSQSRSQSHSQPLSSTPPVTKFKEPKPEAERPTLKKSTSKLGLNIVWSDKPVNEEPKEEVETESMMARRFKMAMPDITWEHERKAAEAEAAAKYAEEQKARMAEEEARAAAKSKLRNKYAQALREEMARDKAAKAAPPVGWSRFTD